MRVLSLVALLVSAVSVSAWEPAKCGTGCTVNSDCGLTVSEVCGACMNRVCGSGCGVACLDDNSCKDVNCPSCSPASKTCGPSPTPTPSPASPCGGSCQVDSHCSGECTMCFKLNNATTGTCGQGCNSHCTLDSHCLDPNCNSCNSTTKLCGPKSAPIGKCGANCTTNNECGGDCKICFKSSNTTVFGICGEGCGAPCAADTECVDPNCGVCNTTSHKCGPKAPTPPTPPPAGTCASSCTTDAGCTGECNLCFKKLGSTVGTCGVGCNGNCTADAHCSDSNCPSCNLTTHKCGPKPAVFDDEAKCSNDCVVDTDCQISGVKLCGLCMQRKCASGCSMACDVDAHCGDSNCPHCSPTTKLCGPKPAPTPAPTHTGGCGYECVVDTQCIGECDLCFKAANQTNGKCGVGCNAACTSDAHCADDNCPVCNMTSKTCGRKPPVVPTPAPSHIGGCGSSCVVDTNCGGECNLCFKSNNQTSGKCGVGCNSACTSDIHCADSNCPTCDLTKKICVAKPSTPSPSQ
eukprot:TRINITY_DN3227_c3_g1_i1.p1 TRINITY_DN3227_c3_g1~~TRINITY_DN3227_c3_g1_i1.p1  ORF type:complete len:540 (+),score=129.61 TRINITY_DN3227_c3_g1_i1:65-1621(+)